MVQEVSDKELKNLISDLRIFRQCINDVIFGMNIKSENVNALFVDMKRALRIICEKFVANLTVHDDLSQNVQNARIFNFLKMNQNKLVFDISLINDEYLRNDIVFQLLISIHNILSIDFPL